MLFSKKLGKVAAMEFKMTAANRAFVIITIIGPFLIVAISVLPGLATMRTAPQNLNLALASSDSAFLEQVIPEFEKSGITITRTEGRDSELNALLLAGKVDGYLILPPDLAQAEELELVVKDGRAHKIAGTLNDIIGPVIIARRLAQEGLSARASERLLKRPAVEIKNINTNGEEKEQDFNTALFTAMGFTFLLYMTVLLYGQSIGRSVVLEKTSKTVEIMLSSVHTRDLLFGKILGRAAAGLLQYGIWILMALVFLKLLAPLTNTSIPIAGGPELIAFLLLFFLLAFFLYASAYAALGAACSDEQHLGQLAWPLILFLVLPMLMIGSIVIDPDALFPRIMSFFPLTAPIVMFQRIALGTPKAWEIATSVFLTAATLCGVVVLSAKIFRIGILMSGKRFKLGEVLRWIGYR